jgi:hypothetical protein
VIEIFSIPFLLLFSISFRLKKHKKIDIGIGPEPLINNYFHKLALEKYGYTVETYVNFVYHIFDKFDYRLDHKIPKFLNQVLYPYILFFRVLYNYKGIYIYFNGGPLGFTKLLWAIEPLLYKIANVKTVITAYGSDVQVMSRSKNLIFKNAMSHDYPLHNRKRTSILKKIDLWSKHADHIIGGCEWVDYMHHWDTLMLGHFCIDTEDWKRDSTPLSSQSLKIFHAPNHKMIKGSRHILKAINELKNEGYNIELIFKERCANSEIKKLMQQADLVIDQLIIGWYAQFAIEAMSMEIPVMVFLRQDLVELYEESGLLIEKELPFIRADFNTIKQKIKWCCENREILIEKGKESRKYVLEKHSLEYIGSIFDKINKEIGLKNKYKQH